MVAAVKQQGSPIDHQASHQDRFVDWLFELTDDVREGVGLPEKSAAQAVEIIIARVQQQYGGKRPYVHSASHGAKKTAILQRWQNGWDVKKIAVDVGCTESWIRRVLNEEGLL